MDFSDENVSMRMLNVLTVPAFSDNYLWIIHDGVNAAVVDPGDATPIMDALNKHKLSLVTILLTHHHSDHVGGVARLLQHYDVPVYAPRKDPIAHVTQPLDEGDTVSIAALDLKLSVLDVPGHTLGHIAYVAKEQGWLFCGDTLFAGGCGRLFEGTPAQMLASLEKLAALPDDTKVYCAHEYTIANLRFAMAAEPGNDTLAARYKTEQAKREQGLPTVPSSIGLEKSTNPFLRTRLPALANQLIAEGRLDKQDPVAVFAALREWKNDFR